MKFRLSIWALLLAPMFMLFAQSGKPVARVNGSVLTDRDLLREMYIIFPYARVQRLPGTPLKVSDSRPS